MSSVCVAVFLYAGPLVSYIFPARTLAGKAGVAVELGVPVCVMEDQHQFILGYRVMWEEHDVDIAVDLVKGVKGVSGFGVMQF